MVTREVVTIGRFYYLTVYESFKRRFMRKLGGTRCIRKFDRNSMFRDDWLDALHYDEIVEATRSNACILSIIMG